MKYKIKIIEIDENLEDVEFFVNFQFLDSKIRYRAALIGMNSKILKSFVNKEVTADLILEYTSCKKNHYKKNTWLNLKKSSVYPNDAWINPEDIEETQELSSVYLCSGKILGITVDDFEHEYYRLASERIIDVDTDLMYHAKDSIKPEDIQIGGYYSFRGALTINSIDEEEELYKNKV